MADVFLFIRHAWKSIWKQKTIWLFSAIPLFTQMIPNDQLKLRPILAIPIAIVSIVLFYASTIGVPYIAYHFAMGQFVTVQEAFLAVQKYAGRLTGASLLAFLIISPCLFLVLVLPMTQTGQVIHFSAWIPLALLPLSIFSGIWDFLIFGFFGRDHGILSSIKEAIALFTKHFSVLAALGLTLGVVLRAYIILAGLVTITVQSGLNSTALSNLDILNPSNTLSNNIVFVLLTGIGQVIYTPTIAIIFAMAYTRYSNVNVHSYPK